MRWTACWAAAPRTVTDGAVGLTFDCLEAIMMLFRRFRRLVAVPAIAATLTLGSLPGRSVQLTRERSG